ncbi:MAG: PilZ domain-containing protein [Desulfobacterales bacterium]
MTQIVFVNQENKAIFTCPKCTKAKNDVSRVLNENKKAHIKVKCPCGHILPVILERRKFYRKTTTLHGIFIPEKNLKEHPLTVVNLSRSGLEFKSTEISKLQVGDRLKVKFWLDNNSRSLISKTVIIRKIEEHTAGTEFCEMDEYDKVLGFYLFN